jgi:hypothetical protein
MGRLELTAAEIDFLIQILEQTQLSGSAQTLRQALTMLEEIQSKLSAHRLQTEIESVVTSQENRKNH